MNERIDWENPYTARDFKFINIQPDDNSTSGFGPNELQAQRMADCANTKFREILKEQGINVFSIEDQILGTIWTLPIAKTIKSKWKIRNDYSGTLINVRKYKKKL